MVKPKFEVFKKNETVLGVVAKDQRLAARLNKQYKRYSAGYLWVKGEEGLFWVPLRGKDLLEVLLRLRGPLNLDLVSEL